MNHTMNLRTAAALYVLGKLPSWDIPSVANEALKMDVYSQTLADLASQHPDSRMADLGPLFEQALRELDIALPSFEDGVAIALRHFAAQLARHDKDPLTQMGEMRLFVLDVAASTPHFDRAYTFVDLWADMVNLDILDPARRSREADDLRAAIRRSAVHYIADSVEPGP